MMKIKVAINGFGRIGRNFFKALYMRKLHDVEVVAINDLTSPEMLAYLLKYDSVYGKFQGHVSYDSNSLYIDGKHIRVFAERDPENLPWKNLDIDVVIESTGHFTDANLARKHLKAGAKKVVISAPAKNEDLTIVKGVNEHLYDNEKHHVVSNASCTTNAAAPLFKVLNDNFSVEEAYLTTIHAYTATQNLVDGPNKKPTRARAAAINIVPSTTGASKAVEKVIPELKGKLAAYALRVPVPTGSIVEIFAKVNKATNVGHINWLFSEVSKYHLKGVLEYNEDPIVSSDIVGNAHSVIFDANYTEVMNSKYVRIVGWYDNEWGYSNRLVDLLHILMR